LPPAASSWRYRAHGTNVDAQAKSEETAMKAKDLDKCLRGELCAV